MAGDLLVEPGPALHFVQRFPEAMREDLLWVIRRLVSVEAGNAIPDFIFAASDHAARGKPHRALSDVVKTLGESPRAQVVMLAGDVGSDALAAVLPEPTRIGPPDREIVAAALSLADAGGVGAAPELPSDAALRALGYHGLRIAMRSGDRPSLRRGRPRLRSSSSTRSTRPVTGTGRTGTPRITGARW